MKRNNIPSSWASVELNELVDLVGGGTPSRKNQHYFQGEIPWLTGNDLPENKISFIQEGREFITEEAIQNSATTLVPAQTILITSRVTIGKVGVAQRPLCFSQDVTGLIPKDAQFLEPIYLAYFLLASRERLLRFSRGAIIKGIRRNDLAKLVIDLPSIQEQKRIIEILRQADELRNFRQQANNQASQVLSAIFYEMFGDPVTNPKKWPVKSLEELILGTPQNGIYKHSSYYGEGVPIIRIDDFYGGKLNSSETFKRVDVSFGELKKYQVENGNILLNRVNSEEFLGKCALVENLTEETVFESNMMRLIVNEEHITPRYLTNFLDTNYAKQQILRRAKRAVNQASINQQDVKQLKILVPTTDLLVEFEKIAKFFNQTNKLTVGVTYLVNELVESLVAQVFSGDLTATWRKQHISELSKSVIERDRQLGKAQDKDQVEETMSEPDLDVSQLRPNLLDAFSAGQQALFTLIKDRDDPFTAEDLKDDSHETLIDVHRRLQLLEKMGLVVSISTPKKFIYRNLQTVDDVKADDLVQLKAGSA